MTVVARTMRMGLWFSACLAVLSCLPLPDMAKDQMTYRNEAGVTVVCKAPDGPEFKEIGRVMALYWCGVACKAHGFQWIGRGREELSPLPLDLDLGLKERRAVEKYIPAQCLPYEDRRPRGIVHKANGEALDCLGVLYKDGKCPE